MICHREAHVETDECGAPGFYLHGAKLLLAEGEGAKLSADGIEAVLAGITRGIHQVPAHAVSITQASEYGLVYTPKELAAIGEVASAAGLGLHMDGARFANAVVSLARSPGEAAGPADTLSFGCVKNGGMSAEAIVFLDPERAEIARWRRKRRRAPAIEGPLPRRADPRLARGRSLARERPRRERGCAGDR